MKRAFTGPVASVSTPFTKNGDVDYGALRNMVDFFIAAGSPTMLLTYGDSLYSVLTDDEITKITKTVIEQTAGRACVVACGKWALPKTLEFADACRGWGADALMLYPPDWAGSCDDETLYTYYTSAAERIPVILMTALMGGRPLPIALVERLIDSGAGVAGIKDDICGEYGKKLVSAIGGRIAFLSGGRKINHFDQYFFGEVHGYLSVYLRFLPRVAWLYYNAVTCGNYELALSVIKTFDMPFFDELTAGINLHFDAVIRAAMEVYGICERWRRLPYMSANDMQADTVKNFLNGIEQKISGFIKEA